MGVKWKDFVRNEDVWKRSKFKEGTLIRLIMRQQMTFLGHKYIAPMELRI